MTLLNISKFIIIELMAIRYCLNRWRFKMVDYLLYGVVIALGLTTYKLQKENRTLCNKLNSSPCKTISKSFSQNRDEQCFEDFCDIDIFSGNHKNILTWRDPDTNLMWEVKNSSNFDDQIDFENALKHVENLNMRSYGGYRNWRLPTIDELLTLGNIKLFDQRDRVQSSAYDGVGNWLKKNSYKRAGLRFVKKPFGIIMNAQISSWYWSSTPYTDILLKDDDVVWVVDFFEGSNFHNCKNENNLVISVRNLNIDRNFEDTSS
jgi:hypothetical protein